MSERRPEALFTATETIEHAKAVASLGWFGGVVAMSFVSNIDNLWVQLLVVAVFLVGYYYLIENKANHWLLHNRLKYRTSEPVAPTNDNT